MAIGLLVLAFINYRVNLSKLHENEKWQRNIVYQQVKNIAEIYDHGLLIYEEDFDARLKNLSAQVLASFEGREEELQKINPDTLRKQFQFDTLTEDFYVLDEHYTIVNTSFAKDSGMNFVVRDHDLKPFFDSMMAINYCHVDRFTTERITGNFRKYSYMPSNNKKIILELGASSVKATNYKAERNKKVEEIKSQFPEMLKIQLLQANDGSEPAEIPRYLFKYYDKAIQTKSSSRAVMATDSTTLYNDFIYLPIQASTMFDGYIIHVVTDDSRQRKLIWNEVINALILFVCTLLPLIIILAVRARSITKPIVMLSGKSKAISAGNLNERIEILGNNEITELSENFNAMIEKLQESYETLEQKVKDRTAEVVQQKEIIEEKHKEITDSINYAERIQRSFLATKDALDQNLKDYFVFFQPKDVVSGDFYWASELENGDFIYVTADSTGHGVPGAIMSILNISSLEKSIETKFTPSEILNETRRIIIDRLKKDGSAEGGKDGMDASLVLLNKERTKLTYSAANNPVWIQRNKEIIELNPDKMPVGKHDKDQIPFSQHEFILQKGDIIYTLTDGMPDQFGGAKGKKYKYTKLKETLLSITELSMAQQMKKMHEEFNNWKGDLDQVDDVCVFGVRV